MFERGSAAPGVAGSNSLESVRATQSPILARIARGSVGLSPARTAALSLESTKILPVGSVPPREVTLIGSWIEVMLNLRTGEPDGQRPSSRLAHGLAGRVLAWFAVAPRNGVPECPLGVCGARWPMLGRSSGYAGRPSFGLKRILGRLPTKLSPRLAPGWPGTTEGRFGHDSVSSGSPR
jgi:hypothetical protein